MPFMTTPAACMPIPTASALHMGVSQDYFLSDQHGTAKQIATFAVPLGRSKLESKALKPAQCFCVLAMHHVQHQRVPVTQVAHRHLATAVERERMLIHVNTGH